MSALRGIVVPISLLISLLLPVFFAVAALGTKYGLWDWTFGFLFLTAKMGFILLLLALALGVISVLMAVAVTPRKRLIAALIALIIPAGAVYQGMQMRATAARLPMIHDISTDWADPPQFTERVMVLRGETSNPVLDGDAAVLPLPEGADPKEHTVAKLQGAAYPDVKTITLLAPPDKAMTAAKNVLQAMGMAVYPVVEEGIIEATDETEWFGFKDDVVVRIRPTGDGGSKIDLRSISRVGRSDLGANAERIRTFREQLFRIIL